MTAREPRLDEYQSSQERRLRLRYALLTAALFVPLLLAFIFFRNLYPVGASTMMLGLKDKQSDRVYYVLRGETVAGETVDLPPIELTNALTGRNWSLVHTAVENMSFTIRSPHPSNVALAASYGGVANLPRATRLDELLRAWGGIYNSRLTASSNRKLRAVKLDAYVWQGGINGEYARFVESWRAAL